MTLNTAKLTRVAKCAAVGVITGLVIEGAHRLSTSACSQVIATDLQNAAVVVTFVSTFLGALYHAKGTGVAK